MVGKLDPHPQFSLFETPLVQFIDLKHPLCVLAKQIDWERVEKDFSEYYVNFGRPSVPIRKMVGLVLLKHLKNLSDEALAAGWKENPYWQYFCGEVHFQTSGPIDPSEFVHFRKRIGESGSEKILKLTIDLFSEKEVNDTEVLIDTTVQEKNITFPTDSKLQKRIIDKVVKIAKREGIQLRQTYSRTLPQLMIEQRQRNHPRRKKKANAAARKIKTIAGRVVRDLENKMTETQKYLYTKQLEIFKKVLAQERNTPNKIYSLHEVHVKCIAKGKDSKDYEFGNKSSIVKTRTGIIIGAMAFSENLYDGDTLQPQLDQVERITGHRPKVAIVDRGYRGRCQINDTQICTPKPLPKSASAYQKQKTRKRFRNRAGIEPIIGHLKYDHRMIRNFLKGQEGDKVNTLLAAAAFNLKKMINRLSKSVLSIFFQILNTLYRKYQFTFSAIF